MIDLGGTRFREARGTALAELALVLPLLLVLLLGMLDFGKALNEWIDETHLANEAVRLAAVNYKPDAGWPSCPTTDPTGGIGCYIQRTANIGEFTNGRTGNAYAPTQDGAKVCIDFPDVGHTTPVVGDPVEVEITVDYQWLNYVATWLSPTTPLRGKATMRLEALPTNYTSGCYTPPAPA
jgi:hypothetical protein